MIYQFITILFVNNTRELSYLSISEDRLSMITITASDVHIELLTLLKVYNTFKENDFIKLVASIKLFRSNDMLHI